MLEQETSPAVLVSSGAPLLGLALGTAFLAAGLLHLDRRACKRQLEERARSLEIQETLLETVTGTAGRLVGAHHAAARPLAEAMVTATLDLAAPPIRNRMADWAGRHDLPTGEPAPLDPATAGIETGRSA